jgi:lipopolysaccharide biosynthesis glycosyltransferase
MTNLVLTTTANYLWGAAVTVRSALERCSDVCNVYIINIDLTSEHQKSLINSWQTNNIGKIEFIPFDKSKTAAFRTTLHVRNTATYARLFIDDCLPNLSRCIFLDTDLIVCADLKQLDDIDLMGNTVGCVRDGAVYEERQRWRFENELGLQDPSLYFNVGVILADLDAWRDRQVQSRALQICKEMYNSLDALDQDALNIVLQDDWLELEPKWNMAQYNAPEDFDDGIIHLFGRVKPWHADYNYKFKTRFFEILDRTAFAGKRPAELMGIGAVYKRISRSVPTLNMIKGKVQRVLR